MTNDAVNNAMREQIKIMNALKDMEDIIRKIPQELQDSKQHSREKSESIREVSQAGKHLEVVNSLVPNITSLLNDLKLNQQSIESNSNDIHKKIENLRQKIGNARELADRFKIGVTFYRNTTLELKNPENLPLLATATKVSLYFRTNKTNGFLLYLGNEEKANIPRSKTVRRRTII